MTTFFIDLWQDLREKRLWPVAVGLLAATLAIPLLMFKPTSAPPAQPAPPAAATGPKLPVVTVDTSPLEGSKLSQFSAAKNPFMPLSDLPKTATSSSASAPTTTTTAAAHNPVSGTTNLLPHSSTPSTGGSGGASTTPPKRSSSSTGTTTTTTKWFRYSVDVKFGKLGQLKTLKNQFNLAMLPNAKSPVVMFMGATSDGTKALFFLADPSYTPSGKGTCNVSGANCRIVTLTLKKDTETFDSVDGTTTYKLQLLKINRVPFAPKSSTGSNVKSASAGDTGLAQLDATQLVPDLLSLVGASADSSQG